MKSTPTRRGFLAATAFTIVPRHVLGAGYLAPSDKVTLACIGTGTQALREMLPLLASEKIRIVAVCDPCREAAGYRDWSKNGLLQSLRAGLKKPDWRAGTDDLIPGGLNVGKDLVETSYGQKGCKGYADFREMLEKEKDLDAVKVMTPDHLHGVASIAAMKRRKHVIMHKPIANRLTETQMVIAEAKRTRVATHFMPWDSNGSMEKVLAWIHGGAIGKLREVHNWTNRPVWPQFPDLPKDTPPVPEGFNWDLWLGPEAERPYHPNYTHMVFRGWFDFGGGSMADMGHYSLWTVFRALELSGPTVIEPMLSRTVSFDGDTIARGKNTHSFPNASVVRFKYPKLDLIWYEGGIRPPAPEELEREDKDLPAEGMMFVGEKGKILAGFRVENPRLLSEKSTEPPRDRPRRERNTLSPGMEQWVAACKGGKQSPGSFLTASGISEAVNLYAVALRTQQKLRWDAAANQCTNSAEANRYLSREYRKGWDPKTI
ncbi:MAG: Gfo/Idh/MocA family oxidoreductase [Acidobacteria bacterium]|nr:Gfo/Idh/MocA family oxidoreductase [Acidobacteriota bacterium]